MTAQSIPMDISNTRETSEYDILWVWATCIFVAGMFFFAWVGYLDSDDGLYSTGAINWLQGPFVGTSHFDVRHPVLLAIAASYAMFGIGVLQLGLVSTFFSSGTLVLVYYGLKQFGVRTACLGVALLASLPLFAINATITFCDTIEMFFVALSFFMFVKSIDSPNRVKWLIFAGVIAAIGYLSRATTVALLASYGLLFLFNQGIKRSQYWWMAGGFLFVVGIEAAIMFAVTGDPLYRLNLAWANVAGTDKTLAAAAAGLPDQAGNIHLNAFLDPLLIFFANHEFSIMFLFALPAAIWACFMRPSEYSGTILLRWLCVLGVTWAVVMTVVLSKYSHPRYFLVTCVCFIFPLAIWFNEVVIPRLKWFGIGLVLLLFTANFTGIYVDNKNPLSGEYMLKDFMLTNNESVYTDPYTAVRARFILEEYGIADRLKEGAPPTGELYFFNPGRLESYQGRELDAEPYLPKESWLKIMHREPDRKLSGIVLEKLGLSQYIPDAYLRRLDRPWAPVEVYRVSN